MDSHVNTLVTLNKVGATNMDKTLSDYINRTMEKLKDQTPKEIQPNNDKDNYDVYPEDDGYDRPRNPYSSH